MEQMDCDHLETQGIHLLTRLGSGEERVLLVWRLLITGGVEENPCDEIEFSPEDLKLAESSSFF